MSFLEKSMLLLQVVNRRKWRNIWDSFGLGLVGFTSRWPHRSRSQPSGSGHIQRAVAAQCGWSTSVIRGLCRDWACWQPLSFNQHCLPTGLPAQSCRTPLHLSWKTLCTDRVRLRSCLSTLWDLRYCETFMRNSGLWSVCFGGRSMQYHCLRGTPGYWSL